MKKDKHLFDGNDNARDLARKSKQFLKDNKIESPDLTKMFSVKVDNRTTLFTNSPDRYEKLEKKYRSKI